MWIEIFKAGTHTDSSGNTHNFSELDIQNIADIYNAEKERNVNFAAPLVKGHPKSDSPAFAWVEKLARRANSLYAKLSNIDEEISKDINSGKFKNISVALYPNKLLKHVGLLGAVQPAVKGLAPLNFNEFADSDSIINDLMNEKKQLSAELDKLRNQSRHNLYSEFADKMISENMLITPAKKNSLIDILNSAAKLNDGETKLDDEIMNFIESIGNYNLTMQIPNEKSTPELPDFAGNYDESRMNLHSETLKLMQNLPELSYEEAAIKAYNEFIINY